MILRTLMVALVIAPSGPAQTRDAAELTALLNEFLAGASRNDASVHERFWAEDLVYTGSSGRRIGKADIMKDVRGSAGKPDEHPVVYTAADVRVQQYGDTAVAAFRLVATTQDGSTARVRNYLNTGTFVKRKGRWQVVGWQATRVPLPEDQAKKEAVAAEAAFHRALLAADVKALQPLLDEGFVWTDGTGARRTRQQLLDDIGAGRLTSPKPDTGDAAVTVHGDTAVVGTAIGTVTLVNGGDGWKAVALHTR